MRPTPPAGPPQGRRGPAAASPAGDGDILCIFTGAAIGKAGTRLIETQTMTIDEAKDHCKRLPGCKGFTFSGSPDDSETLEVRFFSALQCMWDPASRGRESVCFRTGARDGYKPVVEAILDSQGRILHDQGASWVRSHRRIILALVQQRGLSLRHASDELRGDRELALAALGESEDALPYVEQALWSDPDFVLAMVKRSGLNLRYASEPLRGEREVVLAAVTQEGTSLQHAAKKLQGDRDVVAAAVQQRVEAFEFASAKLREDPDYVQSLMKQNPIVLRHASDKLRSNPDFILPLVRRNDSILQFASDALRSDREFVLKIVEKQGDAVRHAWHTMWEDGEVILAAGQQDARAMRHAGKAAWSNRDFVLTMVRKNWRDLRHASDEVKEDREIAKVAIAQSPEALQFVGQYLKEDPEIVYLVYCQDEATAVRFARPEVFTEREFALAVAGVKVPKEWSSNGGYPGSAGPAPAARPN